MACIGCGLCIDACNSVMPRFGLPPELITYDSINNQIARARGEKTRIRLLRPRTIAYMAILAIVAGVMVFSLSTRSRLEVNVIPDRQPLFVKLSDGSIRNGYTFKILNMQREPKSYILATDGLIGGEISVLGRHQDSGPYLELDGRAGRDRHLQAVRQSTAGEPVRQKMTELRILSDRSGDAGEHRVHRRIQRAGAARGSGPHLQRRGELKPVARQRADGWWYPWTFVAGMLVVIAVNIALVIYAVGTFPGLETDDAYRKGLAYNKTLAAARAQEARAGRVDVRYAPRPRGRCRGEPPRRRAGGHPPGQDGRAVARSGRRQPRWSGRPAPAWIPRIELEPRAAWASTGRKRFCRSPVNGMCASWRGAATRTSRRPGGSSCNDRQASCRSWPMPMSIPRPALRAPSRERKPEFDRRRAPAPIAALPPRPGPDSGPAFCCSGCEAALCDGVGPWPGRLLPQTQHRSAAAAAAPGGRAGGPRPRQLGADRRRRYGVDQPVGRGSALCRLRLADRGGARPPAGRRRRPHQHDDPPPADALAVRRDDGRAPGGRRSRGSATGWCRTTPPASKPADAREEKALLRAMAVAGFAAGNVMLLSVSIWAGHAEGMGPGTRTWFHWLSALIALPAIAYAGRPFLRGRPGARCGRAASPWTCRSRSACCWRRAMSLQQTIAGAEHAYFDAAIGLLFFLLIGRYLDRRARGQARSSAEQLLALAARAVTVVDADGRRQVLPPTRVLPGARVLAAAGERIAVDGRVAGGREHHRHQPDRRRKHAEAGPAGHARLRRHAEPGGAACSSRSPRPAKARCWPRSPARWNSPSSSAAATSCWPTGWRACTRRSCIPRRLSTFLLWWGWLWRSLAAGDDERHCRADHHLSLRAGPRRAGGAGGCHRAAAASGNPAEVGDGAGTSGGGRHRRLRQDRHAHRRPAEAG